MENQFQSFPGNIQSEHRTRGVHVGCECVLVHIDRCEHIHSLMHGHMCCHNGSTDSCNAIINYKRTTEKQELTFKSYKTIYTAPCPPVNLYNRDIHSLDYTFLVETDM